MAAERLELQEKRYWISVDEVFCTLLRFVEKEIFKHSLTAEAFLALTTATADYYIGILRDLDTSKVIRGGLQKTQDQW